MTAKTPRCTVLVTVLNGMPYLPQAVESILRQSDGDFLMLIINNGSGDGTAAYLATVHDPRVTVLSLSETIPRTAVLNKGLEQVTTAYTAILDADDVAEPTRLARQTAFLDANPQVALVGSDILYINRACATIGREEFPTEHSQLCNALPLFNQFAHSACMFRSDAARAVGGYPTEFPYAQDMGLWIALLRAGHMAASIAEPLARIRVHPGQATRNLQLVMTRRADNHTLAERMLGIPGLSPAARQAALLRSAAALWGLGHHRAAGGKIWQAVREHPAGLFCNPVVWRRLRHTIQRRMRPIRP